METTLIYRIHNISTNRWYSFRDYFKAEKLKQKLKSYGCKVEMVMYEKPINRKISKNQISLI